MHILAWKGEVANGRSINQKTKFSQVQEKENRGSLTTTKTFKNDTVWYTIYFGIRQRVLILYLYNTCLDILL